MVLIFHLGFGQGGMFHHAPHDRLGTAIKLAGLGEFQQLAGNGGLGLEGHGGVGVLPVALHAQALELLALHVNPVGGKGAALLAEFVDRNLVLVLALGAILLFDLPFDGQAMAIPARHVIGVKPGHLARAGDDVLQDLVQRMADVDVAVGIGRAVMKHEQRLASGLFAQTLIEPHGFPALENFRLLLGQTRLHGKVGFRQEHRLAVAVGFFGLVGHLGTFREIRQFGPRLYQTGGLESKARFWRNTALPAGGLWGCRPAL